LLEERFKLAVHKDTKPVPTWVLSVGKKVQLKEADGSGDPGCKPQSGPAPVEGGIRLMTAGPNGATTTLNLGPGGLVQYACRNMTMASFTTALHTMVGANVGSNAILDQTELKGIWNFDLKYSLAIIGPMMGDSGSRISIYDAIEKQLGLKLEEKPVPAAVIVVDKVERVPGANPPGAAEALAAPPPPTEFEVASIKPAGAPNGPMMINFQMKPGGRLTVQSTPMRFVIQRAFNTFNNDEIAGLPDWADSERFEINAKAPSPDPNAPPLDQEAMAPMLRALLVDRFKLKYHTEERSLPAYSLVAGKPKMKKADPESRTYCRNSNAPAGAPPGSRVLTCQNVTMAQFAERLQNMGPGLNWPVLDATGIQGSWDFTLTFSQRPMMAMRMGPGGPAGGPPGEGPAAASDPMGGGYTIFEAVEKQLGLKLESQKRPLPVIVIDHIEQKPTEN